MTAPSAPTSAAAPDAAAPVPTRPRDHTVDALRVLALACIVLAHCSKRDLIFQLRTFDVTCMAFLSGLSYRLAGSKGLGQGLSGYLSYLGRRVKRLIVPTWTFLAIFYTGMGLLHLAGLADWVGWRTVRHSFLLHGDSNYVWIMRVYLLLALVSPGLAHLSRALPSNRAFLALILALLVGLRVLLGIPVDQLPWPLPMLYTDWLLYLVGYGIAALVGYRHPDLSRRERLALASGLGLAVLAFCLWKGGAHLQDYKYPPHPYYIAYGIAVSLALYELLALPRLTRLCASKQVQWVSQNSLWIYLWHIVPVTVMLNLLPAPTAAPDIALRWLVCVTFASCASWGLGAYPLIPRNGDWGHTP